MKTEDVFANKMQRWPLLLKARHALALCIAVTTGRK